jgi:hypothetical protein
MRLLLGRPPLLLAGGVLGRGFTRDKCKEDESPFVGLLQVEAASSAG